MTELSEVYLRARALPIENWIEMWLAHARGEPTPFPLPAFPPVEVQKITNNLSGEETMRAAAQLYRIVDAEISAAFGDDSGPLRVLDYGAGWGRITRLLLRNSPPSDIAAFDVEPLLVNAGQRLLPGIDFLLVGAGERTPFSDRSFDLIYANSVLSHLPEELHMFVVSEVARLLRPGGIFLGTTLSLQHCEKNTSDGKPHWIVRLFGSLDDIRTRIGSNEFLYAPTPSDQWQQNYGIALLPSGWTRARWPDAGLRVTHERTDYGQDVNVAVRV